MNYNLLKLNMYSLAKNQQLLRAAGGPEFNGLLFEEIIALEEEILAQFGLPVCQRYLNHFEFTDELDDMEIDFTISLLELEADAYLGPAEKDRNRSDFRRCQIRCIYKYFNLAATTKMALFLSLFLLKTNCTF
jgi:hypothetical protein